MHPVGILALQGNFALHGKMLDQLGIKWRLIRKPEELNQVGGLIIPGGESTALLILMRSTNWLQVIPEFAKQGKTIFGTCAGLILLAQSTLPEQTSLGLIDIEVKRNAYGSQINSFVTCAKPETDALGSEELPLVFIRAPKINSTGEDVEKLVILEGCPVLVRQANILAASFHPELSDDTRVHKYFVDMLHHTY